MPKHLKKIIFLLTFSGLIYFLFIFEKKIEYGPGIKAPNEPVQKNIRYGKVIELKGFQITPLAEYDITAKILSIETYSTGPESEISPADFALGWKLMSDERILEHINIRQARRWYYWRSKNLPVRIDDIKNSSANVHLIPADDFTEDLLSYAVKGQIIRLKGYLVEVNGKNINNWRSSLSRTDDGNHACEIMYVKSVEFPQIDGTESE